MFQFGILEFWAAELGISGVLMGGKRISRSIWGLIRYFNGCNLMLPTSLGMCHVAFESHAGQLLLHTLC